MGPQERKGLRILVREKIWSPMFSSVVSLSVSRMWACQTLDIYSDRLPAFRARPSSGFMERLLLTEVM